MKLTVFTTFELKVGRQPVQSVTRDYERSEIAAKCNDHIAEGIQKIARVKREMRHLHAQFFQGKKMKAILFAAVALISAGSMPHFTFAQDNVVSQAGNPHAGVNVIRIKKNNREGENRFVPSPASIAQAQDELQSDSGLRAILAAKRVPLQHVVGIRTALNGGKIVYVR